MNRTFEELRKKVPKTMHIPWMRRSVIDRCYARNSWFETENRKYRTTSWVWVPRAIERSLYASTHHIKLCEEWEERKKDTTEKKTNEKKTHYSQQIHVVCVIQRDAKCKSHTITHWKAAKTTIPNGITSVCINECVGTKRIAWLQC